MNNSLRVAKPIVACIIILVGVSTSLGDTGTNINVGSDGWTTSYGIYNGMQVGWKVSMKESVLLQSVTVENGSACSGVRIYDSSKIKIAEAGRSGNVASFSPNVPLTLSNSYYIVGYGAPASSHPVWKQFSFPVQYSALNIIAGIDNTVNPDGFGSADTNEIWDILEIDYLGLPTIVAQPQSQLVLPGSNITFAVAATGVPPLSYQWFFNAAAFPGATNSILLLTNVEFMNAGAYSVVVTNVYGSVTSSIVSLLVPDDINVGSDGWTTSYGIYNGMQVGWKVSMKESVLLQSVTVENGSACSGVRIYDSSKIKIAEAGRSGNVASFSPNVPLTLSNSYYIVGYGAPASSHPVWKQFSFPVQYSALSIIAGIDNTVNGDGFGSADTNEVWDILEIDCLGLPAIVAQPQSQAIMQWFKTSFSVWVIGTSPFSYQWFFNGTAVFGATNSTLPLSNVQFTNAGLYSVVVTNAYGSVTSSVASLTVIADTTGDGIPDSWKRQYGLNPLLNDANQSLSDDGLSNLEVYLYDTTNTLGVVLDPRNPYSNPNGASGMSDFEFVYGNRSARYYYDRNDRLIGVEYQNGTTIGYQYDANGSISRQLTFNRYQSFDGLPALWKFANGLNPTNCSGTNSIYADADGDGWSNYQEWQAGSNPLDPTSVPVTNIVQSTPITAVLPQTTNVGILVPVLTCLSNAVGGSVIPYLQYEAPGSTNDWQDAVIAQADGVPYTYSFSNRIAALPTGSDHVLTWNAGVMFTNNMSLTAQTNVLLRACAQSVTATGLWSAPVNYTLVADADGNGLPDAWELQYFGHTGVNPNDDPDQDGFSNLQEYIADTNPLDSNSYLRITSVQVSTNGVQINWSGGVQAWQYLQRISSIGGTNTWVNIQTVQPPTAVNGSYLDVAATNGASFYRIRVQRP